jgi:hypothetical protein
MAGGGVLDRCVLWVANASSLTDYSTHPPPWERSWNSPEAFLSRSATYEPTEPPFVSIRVLCASRPYQQPPITHQPYSPLSSSECRDRQPPTTYHHRRHPPTPPLLVPLRSYLIFRVLGVGTPESLELLVLTDPWDKCARKELRLCVLTQQQ